MRHHTHALRYTRNTASTAALLLAAARIADVLHLINLTEPASIAGLVLFVTSVVVAAAAGYRLKLRRATAAAEAAEQRAQRAELENARIRRQETLLDGDEDRELWASVPALNDQEDTCAFGTNVHALNQYRIWRQQAG